MASQAAQAARTLPTRSVRALDGTVVRLKVVQSESETLAQDLLSAFQSNVRRIRARRKKLADAAQDAA